MHSHELTCKTLVLDAPRTSQALLRGALAGLLVAASCMGLYLWLAPEAQSVRELARIHHQNQLLQKNLEQSRLTARMSLARERELERQIDSLNHDLREQQDELAFFRKAREGKH